jgi:hypothetical protein
MAAKHDQDRGQHVDQVRIWWATNYSIFSTFCSSVFLPAPVEVPVR